MLTTSFGHSIRRNQHCINLNSHLGTAASFVLNQLQKYNIRDLSCFFDFDQGRHSCPRGLLLIYNAVHQFIENDTQVIIHKKERRYFGVVRCYFRNGRAKNRCVHLIVRDVIQTKPNLPDQISTCITFNILL